MKKICPIMSGPVTIRYSRGLTYRIECQGSQCAFWRPVHPADHGLCALLGRHGAPFPDPAKATTEEADE